MELRVIRIIERENQTIGILLVDGKFVCYTLEDKVRTTKIYGVTAIPSGIYKVKILWSTKRGKFVPWILDVPNFEAIQIHIGNFETDTDGCLLVGQNYNNFQLTSSTIAFNKLMQILPHANAVYNLSISIENYLKY